jgi:probable rRNA maturation factor
MQHATLNLDLNLEVAPAVGEWDEARVVRLITAALVSQGVTQPAEVGLTITDDASIQALNQQYRQVGASTDVLSFPLLSDADLKGQGSFVTAPDGILHLGDVVVSLPRAREQAAEFGHSLERELGYLIVHGVLHLLGFDHEHQDDQRRMREVEEAILAAAA